MAATSIPAAPLSALPVLEFPSPSAKPRVCCVSLPSWGVADVRTLRQGRLSKTRVIRLLESLEVEEVLDDQRESSSVEMAPKQKIIIKLRSYWVPLIEDSCKQILNAARNTNAKSVGPRASTLPTKKRVYCVLKSPHVHKDARFHFEIRTHRRLIDIAYPTAQTIDSLLALTSRLSYEMKVSFLLGY